MEKRAIIEEGRTPPEEPEAPAAEGKQATAAGKVERLDAAHPTSRLFQRASDPAALGHVVLFRPIAPDSDGKSAK